MVEIYSLPVMVEILRMQAVPLMVEINGLYLLWWRYSGCSSYGGYKQTVRVMVEIYRLPIMVDIYGLPVVVEIHKLDLLWWRYANCSSYNTGMQTVPLINVYSTVKHNLTFY